MLPRKKINLLRRGMLRVLARESSCPASKIGVESIRTKYSFAVRKIPGNKTILDIGCGTGFGIINSGAPERFRGIDYNKYALKFGELLHQELIGKLALGDAIHINQHFSNVEAITAFEIIEHLNSNQKRKFLSGVKSALAKGGTVIMSTPLSFSPRTLNIYHFRKELPFEEFKKLVEEFFPETEYYGIGVQPKTVSKRYFERMRELVSSIDVLGLRRIVAERMRSKIIENLGGNMEIKPISYYLERGELPRNIISVSRK
jgi:SAM-dependent methyltransferase